MIDLYTPPKPAIVRARDLSGLPTWEQMQLREKKLQGLVPVFCPASVANAPVLTRTAFPTPLTTDTNTYTFSSTSTGGLAHCIIAVGTRYNSTGNISSVTVGGSGATLLGSVASHESSGDETEVGIYIFAAPSSTANIVVNLSANARNCAIAVYSLTNTDGTAYDNDQNTADPINLSMDAASSGCMIAAVYGQLSSGTATDWTGLTEDIDQIVETSYFFSVAFSNSLAGETGRAVTGDWNGGTVIMAGAGASFIGV